MRFLNHTLLTMSVAAVLGSSSSKADDYFMRPYAADDSTPNCEATATGCVGKWNGSVEFGYVAVTGNKDTTSLNGRFNLGYEINVWRHAGFINVVTASSEESDGAGGVIETDSEKYTAQAKSDYKFSDKAYAFGIFDYDKTKDSGFEYQNSLALGVGYSFIKDDVHLLDGELGFGSRQSKTEATLLLPSDTNTETITRVAGQYKWKISETSSFEQKLSTEIGDDNTISKSYSALSAKIIENLALKVSHEIKHQSDVPPNNETRETITSLTVVYSF